MIPLLAAAFLAALPVGAAEYKVLSGHGGPIKGIATSEEHVLTASFDYAIGLFSLKTGTELSRLTGHRAAVNTVIFLPNGRAASGGDDFAVHLWDLSSGETQLLEGHQGKVMSLALSPDGKMLASAGWDGWVGIWSIDEARLIHLLKGHRSNVTDVAFLSDSTLLSSSSDGSIRQWDIQSGAETGRFADHGFGINTLSVNPDAGWLAYGALDGGTRVLDLETGVTLADLTLDRRPILAMAASPDNRHLAVGDGEGYIMVVDTDQWRVLHDIRAAKRGPVWALAWTPDGSGIVAGGIDDTAHIWPLGGGAPQMSRETRSFLQDPALMENGERQFFRKCSICHALSPGANRRAGPTLHGVFGRRAGSLPGYPYSDAMRESDIIWSDETIAALFEIGPDHYTPGSKMPMQQIRRAKDRGDLVRFLKEETGAMK